jgi:eukaryotic-like serine/threonine-protein kinase
MVMMPKAGRKPIAKTVAYDSSLDATVVAGTARAAAVVAPPANDAKGAAAEPDGFDATVLAADAGIVAASLAESKHAAHRTTVLPMIQVHDGHPTLLAEDRMRYEPVGQLGQGGMGEVIKVQDNDIQRTVAIKRMLPGLDDPALLGRFVEEIRTVGQLEHPGIVPVHDVGIDDDGQYYFVMKYVEGETLETIIDKLRAGDRAYHDKYTVERRVEIFIGILEAVHYAHERGIIHRDIKPANVMVGPYGEVVLMDWGIAKRIKDEAGPAWPALPATDGGDDPRRFYRTMEGALMGTPAYMSPEQGAGIDADERSDVYSLCVLLHELLGLEHYLASATSLEEVVKGVLTVEPRFLVLVKNDHQPPPPADLAHLVRKGVRKDPNERYQTVSELLDRLRARQDGYIPIQCPVTFTIRSINALNHFVAHHPLFTYVAAVATGVGALGGVVYGALHLLGVA